MFLDPQNEIGPSISSSVVLCSFVLLVYIVALVLVFYMCPSSVRRVATFPGPVLFPLLCKYMYIKKINSSTVSIQQLHVSAIHMYSAAQFLIVENEAEQST